MTTLRLLSALVASLLLPVTILSACTPEERQFGSSGSGGSGSGGSSSSSSGGMPCTTDTECGASSECQSFACMDGTCGVTFTPMGTAVAVQELGDCQSNVCDGNGYIVKALDLADPVDDGNPCTLDACVGNETQHGFLASGTACNSGEYCDGFGFCVACLDNSQCGSGICYNNACATPECSDMVKNGLETDVDCGGMQCSACPAGSTCVGNPDCKSQVCESAICSAPTCLDMVQNGGETFADCGGSECAPCLPGLPCNAGLDCTSKVCSGNICQEPTCDDNVTNGNETDVDCGGAPCIKCALGQNCVSYKDCLSGNCCVADPAFPGVCLMPGMPCEAAFRSEMTQ